VLPNIPPLDTIPPLPARPPLHLPDDLTCAPTVFLRRDGHVPPLQLLYDGPYTVILRSLHHFTLRIGDKEDKLSTLRLKPCTDPTASPAQPRVRGRPPAPVPFRDFPPPGAAVAHLVHFAPQEPAEPRQEPYPLARRQGFFHAQPPFSTMPPLGPPATAERCPDKTSRPLSSRPGGSPVKTHNCNIPSQASTTPPPPRHSCACVWGSTHICVSVPTVSPPT
jgi:hypothetical protein